MEGLGGGVPVRGGLGGGGMDIGGSASATTGLRRQQPPRVSGENIPASGALSAPSPVQHSSPLSPLLPFRLGREPRARVVHGRPMHVY